MYVGLALAFLSRFTRRRTAWHAGVAHHQRMGSTSHPHALHARGGIFARRYTCSLANWHAFAWQYVAWLRSPPTPQWAQVAV